MLNQYFFAAILASSSPNSSRGLLVRATFFHRFGVKNAYVLPTAAKVALRVFSRVLVEPEEAV